MVSSEYIDENNHLNEGREGDTLKRMSERESQGKTG